MKPLSQSPQALRLHIQLLEIENESLKAQIRKEQNRVRYIQSLQRKFWEWIADRRNYCTWKVTTGR